MTDNQIDAISDCLSRRNAAVADLAGVLQNLCDNLKRVSDMAGDLARDLRKAAALAGETIVTIRKPAQPFTAGGLCPISRFSDIRESESS